VLGVVVSAFALASASTRVLMSELVTTILLAVLVTFMSMCSQADSVLD
jgi:hypothetical protein